MSNNPEWMSFWRHKETVFVQAETCLLENENHPQPLRSIQRQIERLLQVQEELTTLLPPMVHSPSIQPWLEHCDSLLELFANMFRRRQATPQQHHPMLELETESVRRHLGPGRPRIQIDLSTVGETRCQGYTLKEIAENNTFSRTTLFRRMQETGLTQASDHPEPLYSTAEIDDLVKLALATHPNSGYRLVCGFCDNLGYHLKRAEVLDSLTWLRGPDTSRMFKHLPTRIPYVVAHPNSMWHFDGNLKLKTWGFVIHGAVDGYSRRPVWLRVNTNNYAESVQDCFRDAIQEYGVPDRVRCDMGDENIGVMMDMIMLQTRTRRPAIAGPSVENTRIEGLWGHTNAKVSYKYIAIFKHMQTLGMLSYSTHENWWIDGWCLARVYKRRIQASLNSFKGTWDYHRIRTERGHTALRLWIDGWVAKGVRPNYLRDFESNDILPFLPDVDETYRAEFLAHPDVVEQLKQVIVDDPKGFNFPPEQLDQIIEECRVDEGDDWEAIEGFWRLKSRIMEYLRVEELG